MLKFSSAEIRSIYILLKSVAISFPKVIESTKFDAQMRCMLLNLVISFRGRLARNIEYVSI
jgi:hypothetical protein